MARSAPEQAGQRPDAKNTIGGGGEFLSISRRKGNRTVAADIDGRPPKPTEIHSPAACPRAGAHRAPFACPSGQAPPLRADERRGAFGDAATERGHERGGGPRDGARFTCRMETSRDIYTHLRAQWGYRTPRSASSKVPHGYTVSGHQDFVPHGEKQCGARHLCGAQPLRAEPCNTGGCTGDMAGGRTASPCTPYAGASFAGWSGQGGAGGLPPAVRRASR